MFYSKGMVRSQCLKTTLWGYRVQKELEEKDNRQAYFDFSLITAFRVVENVSQKYFEEGFGGETTQENIEHEILEKKIT